MPKVRRRELPRALFDHLLDRVETRQITRAQLVEMVSWLDQQPEVPHGRWFKKFPGMTVCGEGELVKTLLTAQQTPFDEEVQ